MSDSHGKTDSNSWLRIADTRVGEASRAARQGIFARSVDLAQKTDRLGHMKVAYDETENQNFTPPSALFRVVARANRKPLTEIPQQGVLDSNMAVARSRYGD